MSFETHINGNKPVVVDFFATWCGPCKMMEPVLKQLKEKIGENATILKMDIDKNPAYANRYGIQAVPTVIVFKAGKIIWRKTGVANVNELLQQLNGV
ncbi:thiol reductase thioredoxin [Niastella vici]|uniref:Thioredoxin n=1 Tax=Niastella vici TaxID=1703345 RepID=A0A1V9FFM8_9BACT|nr:thioredoxin [Niastella vici]OQP57158.1 thiol reductase thioredoxin [Niastella vici]